MGWAGVGWGGMLTFTCTSVISMIHVTYCDLKAHFHLHGREGLVCCEKTWVHERSIHCLTCFVLGGNSEGIRAQTPNEQMIPRSFFLFCSSE